jgi:hypothetical protein
MYSYGHGISGIIFLSLQKIAMQITLYCQRDIQKSNFEIYFLYTSIKIFANVKIEVNNVKPILHFLTVQ